MQTAHPLGRRTRTASPGEINADMLAFWNGNGNGGDIWVARQEHTDITLVPVTNALLVFAAVREALAPDVDGARVRSPGAMWLIRSAPA